MKLLIAGFNARPIAHLAKKAGHEIGVVDYFGDIDLLKLTRNCFSVLKQTINQKLHRPLYRKPPEYLYYLAETMSDEQNDFDGILLGSAFDRFPDLIKKFQEIGPKVYANNPDKFALTRDIFKIYKFAQAAGFKTPNIEKVKDREELLEIAKQKKFPIVTRSGGGGGGAGIRLWFNYDDLKKSFSDVSEFENVFWLQEYILGTDASASVICKQKSVQIISLNRQLIGDKNVYAPNRFAYCGNIVPLVDKRESCTFDHITLLERITTLFKKINLTGSNGIDFIIKNNDFYFMEVNPRFQGSIECVHYATGYNLVQLHIDTFNGVMHDLPEEPMYKQCGVKGILFNNQNTLKIKRYPKNKWIVDKTHVGVILENGDPFCSIVLPAKTTQLGYSKICKIAKKIIGVNQK